MLTPLRVWLQRLTVRVEWDDVKEPARERPREREEIAVWDHPLQHLAVDALERDRRGLVDDHPGKTQVPRRRGRLGNADRLSRRVLDGGAVELERVGADELRATRFPELPDRVGRTAPPTREVRGDLNPVIGIAACLAEKKEAVAVAWEERRAVAARRDRRAAVRDRVAGMSGCRGGAHPFPRDLAS